MSASLVKTGDAHATPSLDTMETFRPGGSTQTDVIRVIGAPDKKVIIPDLKGKTVWLYLMPDGRSTRASFIFAESSGTLESANWFVNEADPESQLEFVKNRYKTAQFEERKGKWTNPHAAPDELFLIDRRSGLKVEYGQTSRQVEALTWQRPDEPKSVAQE